MLYVPFLAEKNALKNCNKGTINVLQGGGGQRSMVKDHTFTFFLDPSLISLSCYLVNFKILTCVQN